MMAEISYDLVMEDCMSFVEGTFRLSDGEWQVFIFSPADVPEPIVKSGRWDSGVRGVFIRFPRSRGLNRKVVEELLSRELNVDEWTMVRGPDSLQLR